MNPDMMLEPGFRVVQIPSDRVAKSWDYYRELIKKSLPPSAAQSTMLAANLLQAILTGAMKVWSVVHVVSNEDWKIVATFTTVESADFIAGTRNLIMYSMTIEEFSIFGFSEFLHFFKGYAKKTGAGQVIAYTENGDMKRLAEKAGFRSHTTLVLEV